MSKRIIEIHYHPAIKTIIFKDENGNKLTCDELNCWQKSTFVLQEHGEDLFKSIVSAKDGVQEIHIRFFGTQVDYEDFEGMVNYYNNTNDDARFTCEQCGILINMYDMYKKVTSFGNDVIEQLNIKIGDAEKSNDLSNINKNFIRKLVDYKGKIKKKLDRLQSTNINICFVGTYSSGKSSLINAILGEKILPEADESKTAKFFIITSPLNNEKESLIFDLNGAITSVDWNGTALELDGNTGTHEFRKKIQACIDANKLEYKHIQFYRLIDLINNEDDIGIEIKVKFHIPMDTQTMSFTIYDTPGSGSNTSMHEQVLSKAIDEQSNSIVVFVGGVTKLEGEGNSKLLKLLNGENKNSIDIDRSLFVINRSDTTDIEELKEYQNAIIKIKDSADTELSDDNLNATSKLEIPLVKKRLFFTSAAQASAARAMQNQKQTPKEERIWKKISADDSFYMHNRSGNSETATKRMLDNAQTLYDKSDEYDRVYVNSGLFSLVEAIKEYGEKYAMATKVNSLISYVNQIIYELQKEARNNQNLCNQEIEKLDNDLIVIKNHIESDLNSEYESRCPQQEDNIYQFSKEEQKEVMIDPASSTTLLSNVERNVKQELASKKRLKKNMKRKYVDEQNIIAAVNKTLEFQLTKVNKCQNKFLQKKQHDFQKAIAEIIEKDGELTNDAKEALKKGLDEMKMPININYSKLIYDAIKSNTHEKRFLFIKWDDVDTEQLLKDIKNDIKILYSKEVDKMLNDLSQNLSAALKDVMILVGSNIDEYSTKIQTIKQDKQTLLILVENITDTAEKLKTLKNNLEEITWRNEA